MTRVRERTAVAAATAVLISCASRQAPSTRIPTPVRTRFQRQANGRRTQPGGGHIRCIQLQQSSASRSRPFCFSRPALAAIVLLLVYGAGPHAAKASSHAEAPLISQDPRADNTDLYAFVSPDDTSTVTIIANYIPLEAPASGPNFYSFDDTVLYEIKVDNNGDGKEDVGYQFRFHDRDAEPEHVPLQHRADHVAERPELESPADLRRHARPLQEGRQGRGGRQEQAGRARRRTSRRRPTTSARARRRTTTPRGGGGDEPRRRDQGLRRSARRSVLRRPRLDLRPGRAASVQPVPPDPARSGGRAWTR